LLIKNDSHLPSFTSSETTKKMKKAVILLALLLLGFYVEAKINKKAESKAPQEQVTLGTICK